jgi:hypothetical protein
MCSVCVCVCLSVCLNLCVAFLCLLCIDPLGIFFYLNFVPELLNLRLCGKLWYLCVCCVCLCICVSVVYVSAFLYACVCVLLPPHYILMLTNVDKN